MLKINGIDQPIRHCKKERIYGSEVEIKGNKAYLELTITLEHRALEYLNSQGIAHFFFLNASDTDQLLLNETHPSSYLDQM